MSDPPSFFGPDITPQLEKIGNAIYAPVERFIRTSGRDALTLSLLVAMSLMLGVFLEALSYHLRVADWYLAPVLLFFGLLVVDLLVITPRPAFLPKRGGVE